MKKHIWKITTGILLLICVILAISVYDAERRADLFFERYEEVKEELETANIALKNSPEIPEGLTQISFDGGIAISYFLSMDKVVVVCDFNGDNLERESAITICAMVMACENFNTQDAIAMDSLGNKIMSSDDGKTMFYGQHAKYSNMDEILIEKYRTDMEKIW